MILNLCSGDNPIKKEGIINIDAVEDYKPDLVLNILTSPLPYKDGEVDTIWMFHAIEHIPSRKREDILFEISRVLHKGGEVIFSYPEFAECSKRFLDNFQGHKEYWQNTLYGRQLTPYDFHVVPMHTPYFRAEIIEYGFGEIKSLPEDSPNEYYTILSGKKVRNICTREDVIAREVFNVYA